MEETYSAGNLNKLFGVRTKFVLGKVVATANFIDAILDNCAIVSGYDNEVADEAMQALIRHANGDWGEACDEDKRSNDAAVKNGTQILSVYRAQNGIKFWVITEGDRSVTTLLLPEDY